MPEIRFTEEDHAFAQEFDDHLEDRSAGSTLQGCRDKYPFVKETEHSGGGSDE